MLEKTKAEILKAFINGENEEASKILKNWAEKRNYKDCFTQLLEPVLNQLGKLWYKNELSLAQAYMASRVTENLFNEASKSNEFKAFQGESKGSVVIGNIEDDFHSFGRKLVIIFLSLAGWKVLDLGNDIQAEEFVDKAIETNSRIIAVSAMIYNTALGIKEVREEIDKRNLTGKIQLCVGGAIFIVRPNLTKQVGADGTAKNAIDVPELVESLFQKSLSYDK